MCHFVTYWDEGNEGRAESGGACVPAAAPGQKRGRSS
jgi:hypothetical protein